MTLTLHRQGAGAGDHGLTELVRRREMSQKLMSELIVYVYCYHVCLQYRYCHFDNVMSKLYIQLYIYRVRLKNDNIMFIFNVCTFYIIYFIVNYLFYKFYHTVCNFYVLFNSAYSCEAFEGES